MDKAFMGEALALARKAVAHGEGGPFGAVVVRQGTIVGRGWNRVLATNDPSAHAEVTAIRDACSRLGTYWLTDCDLYVNCEPCMMCMGAIYWARIGRVFYAGTGEDAAAIGFADDFIARELCLPPADRSVPMVQTMREDALEVFALWREKEDRREY